MMELVLILNTCLNLCIKYCNNLKHIVSTGCHAVCKDGVSQDRLHRFQDEMLNKLPKSIDLMKECTKKCIKGGFGFQNVCSDKLYLIMAQLLAKLHLLHYIMHTTMGPFEDDLTEIDRILDSVSQEEFRMLNKMLELFITFDKDDDLQIFEIFATIAEFNTGV